MCGATEALYNACRKLTTKTTIRITSPEVPVPTSWAAMNWAEPAKMIDDMAWAARLDRCALIARAPKSKPNGTTPNKMGASSLTPLQNSCFRVINIWFTSA